MSNSSIAVYSGKLVDPFNLKKDDLNIRTVSHSLALINRYTGHTKFPYSVAQHTFLLIDQVPTHLKRAAAMHDWSECLTNDVARPVKIELPEYREKEREIQERIFTLFNEPIHNLDAIHEWDLRICRDEMAVLLNGFTPEWIPVEPLGVLIEEWDWSYAEMKLYDKLYWLI